MKLLDMSIHNPKSVRVYCSAITEFISTGEYSQDECKLMYDLTYKILSEIHFHNLNYPRCTHNFELREAFTSIRISITLDTSKIIEDDAKLELTKVLRLLNEYVCNGYLFGSI